uniref:Uncharacterized protein n=1 Tax=viral metagenome TaxID=1070528 RepID=A0A6M3J5M7_9ZZZZ
MALTTAEQFLTVMGDKVVGCWKITGDASTTTVDLPVGTIDAAWCMDTDATVTRVTWSGGTVTFTTTPLVGAFYVYFIGTA